MKKAIIGYFGRKKWNFGFDGPKKWDKIENEFPIGEIAL